MQDTEKLVPFDKLRERCDPACITRVNASLKMIEAFRAFFESLAYYEIPSFFDRIVPRETAFYMIAEMMARATERAFPILLHIMEELHGRPIPYSTAKGLDRLLIHNHCHTKMAEILGYPVVVFHASKENNKIVFRTSRCPFEKEKRGRPLICAVCLGVILGSTRFLLENRPVYLVRTRKELSSIPPGAIVIQQTRRSRGCRIEVFEK
ncbi:methanogen output domain 1-containing protein [Pyrofollis japonicus]|uniref:methanogen output domain 1-containing protein n=1 Tax=Pyrofollis japonicus TaxID=3060460 RepID=UPI00295BC0C9|nr:methanogen output domain 1-containing protein [Pyrofollis japonicus]